MRTLSNYINGQWVASAATEHLDVENPATGDVLARVPLSTRDEADAGITAAADAYDEWSRIPATRRVRPLYVLAERMRSHEEEIARTLVREMGKSLPDARAEMKRTVENIEAACGMPILQQGDKMIGCAAGIDGEVIRQPLGVFTLIAPFNFPAMVPFWFLPYAIATGNTFVLKPSERVPMTMELITRYLHDSGFPPGVFNLVNGDRRVAEAFIANPVVKGVSVVGSTPTCRAVARGCTEQGKRFQALGGAKNHLVAMPDAKVDDMLRNMVTSCYGCAGQRCMASSAIVAVGDAMYDLVCRRFVEESKKVLVGDPLNPEFADEAMLMGPVISAKAREFIEGMVVTGIDEGATLALDGRGLKVQGCEEGYFVGPTVLIDVPPDSKVHRTEIFGPVVVILKAATLDEAIRIINGGAYGNGASIYTQNGYYARRFKLEVEAGMIGVNVGIPAPVAPLPFGGMKASLFSDIKTQGKAAVDFYTTSKIVTERFWSEDEA